MRSISLKWVSAVLMLIASSSGHAADKPPSVDDLWKVIQNQQKQIDTLNQKLEAQVKQGGSEKPSAQSGSVAKSSESAEVKEVARKTDILSQEVEKLRTALVIPEEKALKSEYGLGPAASKVYHADKGLSIGGYGEAFYQNVVSDQGSTPDTADLLRAVVYLGYRFTDNILFNSELEFEHASTENNGDVSVEFANLDFLLDPRVNIRAGNVLQPVGFINLIHESPYFFGNQRPAVERFIIPSTWHENGVGLFGEILPGLTYTTYGTNGLDAKGFSSTGIRGGRQSGSQAVAEDLAWVMRIDYTPPVHPGLTFGGSAYLGNSGQNQLYAGQQINVFTQLYETHIQWKYYGVEFRALGAWGHIGDAGVLSLDRGQTVGKSNYGWYTEIAYNVLPILIDTDQYLAPFFRYEHFDTIASAPSGFADNPNLDRQVFQFGLQYKPIPNIVIKADYRNFSAKVGDVPDEFNIGLGYVF
ncbi:MAG: hypothetical protein ACRERU_11185 [Methylococcales bacterium]